MNSDQQEQIHQARADLVKSDMEAWKFLLEFHRISDQDIKHILGLATVTKKYYGGEEYEEHIYHTDSSDDARRAILKIYSYETPLYSALNRANSCQDRSAIPTLGPFSKLLY